MKSLLAALLLLAPVAVATSTWSFHLVSEGTLFDPALVNAETTPVRIEIAATLSAAGGNQLVTVLRGYGTATVAFGGAPFDLPVWVSVPGTSEHAVVSPTGDAFGSDPATGRNLGVSLRLVGTGGDLKGITSTGYSDSDDGVAWVGMNPATATLVPS